MSFFDIRFTKSAPWRNFSVARTVFDIFFSKIPPLFGFPEISRSMIGQRKQLSEAPRIIQRQKFSVQKSWCPFHSCILSVFLKITTNCLYSLYQSRAIINKHQKVPFTKSFGALRQKTFDDKTWQPPSAWKFFVSKNCQKHQSVRLQNFSVMWVKTFFWR